MRCIDGWWCPDVLSGPEKFLQRAEMLDTMLAHWAGPWRHVVQAGAHIGIWPWRLAQSFAHVTCFEPAPDNWACLKRNLAASPAITHYQGILGPAHGTQWLNVQPHSTGGHHVRTRSDRPHIPVAMWAIDALGAGDIDAIVLDIEGYELPALLGAVLTIARCQPLLALEQNGCSRKYGYTSEDVACYVTEILGYEARGRYGEDVVYTPRGETRL